MNQKMYNRAKRQNTALGILAAVITLLILGTVGHYDQQDQLTMSRQDAADKAVVVCNQGGPNCLDLIHQAEADGTHEVIYAHGYYTVESK